MKRNFLKSIFMSLALSLCGVMAISNAPVEAKAATSDFPCTYSASGKNEYVYYGSTNVITYTAEEAAVAGIPAGYEGNVIAVEGAVSKGVLLDFSALEIPIGLVKSFDFRFYLGQNSANTGGKPQIRIPRPTGTAATDEWIYQPGNTPSVTGEWATETVEKDFSALANADGNLNKFEISVRSNAEIAFYIDSIAVNLYENDGVAPVLNYKGEDVIFLSKGAALGLDVSAYDAQEKCNKAVEYIWENGVALNENGTPEEQGEYALTLRTKDYYGNASEKTLTVKVSEPDTQKPVINLNFTEMYVQVGTTPIFNVQVTDNRAIAEVTKVWSEGALDAYGRLTEGTHTYTVTAKDTSGNQSQKTLTVYVTVDEPVYDNVIDEEAMAPKYIVTFDGVPSEKTYEHGDKVEKPKNPVKEKDENYYYAFMGWYNGDKKWDFANDVVTGNLDLVSKWHQEPINPPAEDSSEDSVASSEDVVSSDESVTESIEISSDESSVTESLPEGSSSDKKDSADEAKGCFGTLGLTASITTLLGACIVMLKGKKED